FCRLGWGQTHFAAQPGFRAVKAPLAKALRGISRKGKSHAETQRARRKQEKEEISKISVSLRYLFFRYSLRPLRLCVRFSASVFLANLPSLRLCARCLFAFPFRTCCRCLS